ncbi:MAG: DUF5106 domain-containing protein [Bacteroidales bacterium]|nr:DUF5106 domain-containing protein [Bacteroidales bacterium]
MEKARLLAVSAICCILTACGGNNAPKAVPAAGTFPEVHVPGVITDPQERISYMAAHFWDGLSIGKNYDSDQLESVFGTYASILGSVPYSEAESSLGDLFARITVCEAADTSSTVFETISALAGKYFYDPNSPLRDEELYLLFAEGLASSEYVPEEKRGAYAHDAGICRLNRPGTVASDFWFIDTRGRRRHLHEPSSGYTLLIFSNPGCHACGETVSAIVEAPDYRRLRATGMLSVVNVYPDEDLEAWKAHVGEFPKDWTNGFDEGCSIRANRNYSLRAIPSLYLLDKDKRVILKDATIEKLIQELQTIG